MEKINQQEILRHSASHVLATAVLEMFPEAKFGIGPAISDGFYYDFELPRTLIPEDLEILEEKMKKIIRENYPFEKAQMSLEEAKENFQKLNQTYKLELIDDLEKEGEKKVSVFKTGPFVDLCKGPHIDSSGEINPEGLKLLKISGAYWKGDEKNKQLQRIYGVIFENKKELEKYLKNLEEARKRNHRTIGNELELFANFPEIGQGLPVWLPNGYIIRRTLEDYMLKLERSFGYSHIQTPVINKKELFEISGHLGFYNESMYSPIEIDNDTFYLKPMNCPAGMLVYNMKPRSHNDLPYKLGEFGTVHRYEKSGELHGLQRVRGFTQNDAHIFCTPEQLEEQFMEVMEILQKFYTDLGFKDYKFRLSLSDSESQKYVGKKEDWKKAEDTIRQVLDKNNIDYFEAPGEAAFYGPKIDVQAKNVFGKEDSISTIQVDFNLPERFDLNFINKNGKKERPFVIHRALIGSFERFFAFLIEHYAGAFPVWLSPVQVSVIPVSEKFKGYAQKIKKEMLLEDLRVEIDDSDESLGKRIRNAEKQKIPYALIVGEKEMKAETVSVRSREKGEEGTQKIPDFIQKIENEITKKK